MTLYFYYFYFDFATSDEQQPVQPQTEHAKNDLFLRCEAGTRQIHVEDALPFLFEDEHDDDDLRYAECRCAYLLFRAAARDAAPGSAQALQHSFSYPGSLHRFARPASIKCISQQ